MSSNACRLSTRAGSETDPLAPAAAWRGGAGRTVAASAVLPGFALAAGLLAAIRASHGRGRSALP